MAKSTSFSFNFTNFLYFFRFQRRRQATSAFLVYLSLPLVFFFLKDLIDPAKIHQTWKIYDFNHNGKLSLAEIDKALVELFPKYGKDKPVLMRAYRDADKSHVLKNYKAFLVFNTFLGRIY